jgi:hypothetical protein
VSNIDKPRKANVNKGRPLTERHKRAIREGLIRAKIAREAVASTPIRTHTSENPTPCH